MSNIRDLKTYVDNINCRYEYKDIITVEHRSNNPKRDYLFVNRIQGKHIPCNPLAMITMCDELGFKVNRELNAKHKYGHILVVGFAETATAIAHFVAKRIENCEYMMCTTRESMGEFGEQLITFEEEHSHATTQKLFTWKDGRIDLSDIDYILFVEDEISTGNTILNFIKAFQNQNKISKDVKFGVASICNWQDKETAKNFEQYADRYFLISGNLKDVHAKMNIIQDKIKGTSKIDNINNNANVVYRKYNADYKYSATLGRRVSKDIITSGMEFDIMEIVKDFGKKKYNKVRVLGTEECMAPCIELGNILGSMYGSVLCHATTRSKIDIIDDETLKRVIRSRYEIKSLYDMSRQTYIYNMEEETDATFIITNASVNISEHKDLLDLVSMSTNNICIIQLE